jgi:deazaflavin-dependent oxidoreductase (nitroreductase family)
MQTTRKRRLVTRFQRSVLNPAIRALAAAGIAPPAIALLETRGRTTGMPRTTPVGNGLEAAGDRFWIVAEHGLESGYVKNIQADSRVRVKVGRRWRTGTAHVLVEDDALRRLESLPRSNASAVRRFGTDLLTIRIDIDASQPPGA